MRLKAVDSNLELPDYEDPVLIEIQYQTLEIVERLSTPGFFRAYRNQLCPEQQAERESDSSNKVSLSTVSSFEQWARC